MLRLKDILDRLRDQCPEFIHIEPIYDIADLDLPEADLPAAFVLKPLSRAYEENSGMGAMISQAVRPTFAVMILTQLSSEENEPIEEAISAVEAALIGWESGGVQIEASGGDMDQVSDGIMRWRAVFSYQDYARYVR